MNFHNLSDQFLFQLAEQIEKNDKKSALEVEYSEGILEIVILANKKTFVINRNSGNQKIWYSSPFSGADYFSFYGDCDSKNPVGKWINKDGTELTQKLFLELDNV